MALIDDCGKVGKWEGGKVGRWKSEKVEKWESGMDSFSPSHLPTFSLFHPVLKNPICGGVRYRNHSVVRYSLRY